MMHNRVMGEGRTYFNGYNGYIVLRKSEPLGMGSAIGLGHRCSVRPDAGEVTRTHVVCNTPPNGFVIPEEVIRSFI